MASNLNKSKTLLQVLLVLNLYRLYLFAQVEFLTKCSAKDECFDAFKTLTGISSFLSKTQKFSIFFGTCSFIQKKLKY